VVNLRFSIRPPRAGRGFEITLRPVGIRRLAARPGMGRAGTPTTAQQLSIYSGPSMSQIDYVALTSSTAEALSTALCVSDPGLDGLGYD
jgi:hypothetical protein